MKKRKLETVQLCNSTAMEKECEKKDCKFPHDLEAYLKEKEADLGDQCPSYDATGYCCYGWRCRYSKGHGEGWNDEEKRKRTVKAFWNRDFQSKIRKNYDFTVADDMVKKVETLQGKEGEREYFPTKEKKTIRFEDQLYLAPLTTVGNLPFRRICKEFGADITCGEMAVATNLLNGQQSEWALLNRHESEDIFGIQVCGGKVDQMARCAQLIKDQMGDQIDFVDINVGCPIDIIYNKGMGSGLLGKPTRLVSIVEVMNQILDVPLTVKIRTGISSDKNLAHKFVPIFKRSGVAAVTLHGRSREQRYLKLADWDYIKTCNELTDGMPFIGNGDIFSYKDYVECKENSNVSTVMIGRGALIKPWIFTEIKEKRDWDISSTERFEILKKYTNYGLEYFGSDDLGIEKTRRFLLEWLSYLYRYVPIALLEYQPLKMNERPPTDLCARNDLEALMMSEQPSDWITLTERLLCPVSGNFSFVPKHKSSSYQPQG